jgi:hypothetical protein
LADIVVVAGADRFHPDGIDPFGSRESKQAAGDKRFADAGVCPCD